MPVVSVIMPVFNTDPAYLRKAVDSVIAQTCTDWELVIVDNGSSEQGTLACLRELSDPRIKIHRLDKNIGPANARNYAIDHSSGKYLAILDSDDVWDPEKLACQVDLLERNPELGCVATMARIIGDDGFAPFKFYPTGHAIELHILLAYNPMCTSSVVLRKSVLDHLNLRQEPEFTPAEDYRMWTRLLFQCGFAMVEQTLTSYRWYRGNTSNQQIDRQRESCVRSLHEVLSNFVGTDALTDSAWNAFVCGKAGNQKSLMEFMRFTDVLITKLSAHGYTSDEVVPILRHRIRNLFYHTKGLKAQLQLFRSPLSQYFNLPLTWRLFCLITRGVL